MAAATFVEIIFDATMGVFILTFAFTQGVFPKPPDFANLGAFDLSFFAGHLRFTALPHHGPRRARAGRASRCSRAACGPSGRACARG